MSVIMEGFSIREYASRMRSVDVVKCWPFGEASEENVKAILPTITVKKFRWWLDEVERIKINSLENERNYTIEEEGEEESDRDSENLASVRRSRLQKMKSKGKAPKKRSIVELFAVAPEVERVSSEEEDECSDEGSIEESGFGKLKSFGTKNVGLGCKTKQKVVVKKEMGILCTGKHSKLKKVAKKKKRGIMMKEKICKFKSIPSHNCTPSRYGFDNISIHSKKSLATDAKSKARRTYKLIAKNRKADFQGRGMLNRLTKTRVSENKISLLKIQNLNKKYALSVKDAVREGSPRMELDFLKHSDLSVGVTTSNVVDRHADAEKSVSIQEMEDTEEETFKWRGNHINLQPPFENQLCVKCHVNDVPNFLMQHRSSSSNLLDRSVPSDQRAWHNENLLYPCSSGTSLLHLSEDVDARASSSVRSMDYFKPYPQSLPSYSSSTPNGTSVNSNPLFPLKMFGEDYNELSLQRPRLPPMSPKELMRTVCCIPPDQRSTMPMYRERSVSDDLFGLPLNSQGELIRLSYIENGGPNICSSNIPSEYLLGKKPYCANLNGVTSVTNQVEQCAIEGSGNETDYLTPSSVSLIEQLCHYSRTNALTATIGPSFPSDQMNMPCFGARQAEFPKSEIIQQSCSSMQLTPSTMRLMGQEFRIDGSGFRIPENRELYKDKEIMADQHVDTAAYGSSFKSQFLSEPIGVGPKEYNGCRASGNHSHMMAPKSTKFPLFDDQKGYGFSKGNSPHDTYPHADFVSRGHINSILPENLSGFPSLHGYQSFVPAIVFRDTCKNTSGSRLQPEHTEMAIPFQFCESRGNIRPLSLERSSKLPMFLPMGYNQAFGGSDSGVHPPWTTPPMMYQTPEPSKLFPHYGSQNTFASASMIHHPFLPVPSSLQYDDEKMKHQKQYNSRIGSRTLNHGNATKKRLASTISNQYTKPIKMPRSSGSQEDFTSATPVVNARPWDIGYHGLESDSASGRFKPYTVGYGDKNETSVSRGMDSSYKGHGVHRSGPVKLTAGAKHILKPCQRKESTNEPSIATTPFAANQPACEKSSSQVKKP